MKKHNRLMALTLSMTLILSMVVIPTGVSATKETTTSSEWEYVEYTYTCGTEDTSDDIQGLSVTKYLGSQTDVYVPSKLEVNGEEVPVIKLSDGLFKDKTGLNSVTLGEGILEIGASTFEGATNLVCIVTPQSLTTIGANAFSGCTAFNSIILYDAVTYIGENTFFGCDNLTIYCNENNAGYNYAVANGISYIILNPNAEPKIVTLDGIEYYIMNGEAIAISFDGSSAIVTIPSVVGGCPVIELRSTFKGYTSLTNVYLPDSIKRIGAETFYNCYNLVDVELPDEITNIGEKAFYYCMALTNVNLPEKVTEIEAHAFQGCIRLSSIKLPDSLTIISEYVFTSCKKLTSIEIPDGVASIGNCAFWECEALESVKIPGSVTSIGDRAFMGCSNLTNVVIPDGVTNIGVEAFSECVQLSTISIPDSVENIYSSSVFINTVWVVYENSYAHTLAKRNNLLYFVTDGTSNPEIYTVNGVKYFILNDEAIAISFDDLSVSVTIPETVHGYPVTELRRTFYACKTLTNVNLPKTIKSISNKAFYYCESLESIEIPESVTVIEEFTFQGCKNIIDVQMHKGIKEIGRYAFNGCKNLVDLRIPEGVISIGVQAFSGCSALKSIEIPEGVTKIAGGTFWQCRSLESIKIPSTVTKIEGQSFQECESLISVRIPEGVKQVEGNAFSGCDSLEMIYFPKSIEAISAYEAFPANVVWVVYEGSYAHTLAETNDLLYFVTDGIKIPEIYTVDGVKYFIDNGEATAVYFDQSSTTIDIPSSVERYPVTKLEKTFYNCYDLASVTLPDTIETIGDKTFYNCRKLNEIEIPDSVTSIGEYAFYFCKFKNIIVPDSVKTLGHHIFQECNNLLEVVLPSGITTIPSGMFSGCVSLNDIEIPDSVTSIGVSAFRTCNGLTEIVLPDNVTHINSYAFDGCTRLVSVNIPDGVTDIGEGAFSGCRSLSSVNIPSGVTRIKSSAFRGCASLKEITIPGGVTSIGSYALSGCGFKTLNIPSSVISIEDHAFANCRELVEVRIPDSIDKIRFGAFQGCYKLKNVIIPDNIKCVEYDAFSGCPNLNQVIILDGVTTIGSNAFGGSNTNNEYTIIRTVIIPETVTSLEIDSFSGTTILLVYENSYAHTFAVENDLLYFVLHKTGNPEIDYGAGITGTVTYADGTPASNATVEILYDDGTAKETVTADANGNYTFTYAEVGRYTIRAIDIAGNTARETVSVKRMNVFDVYLAGETDLVLHKGYSVSGTVSHDNAKVMISDTQGNVIKSLDTTNGSFVFTDIPRGAYIVKAENNKGSASAEIYVSNADVTGLGLEIQVQSVTISGDTKIENRDGTYSTKVWVNVELIDDNGNVVSRTTTDADGKYIFENVPKGKYSLVAVTNEIRPVLNGGYDKSYELKGYAYVNVTELIDYTVGTIILSEEKDKTATVSGKVTANGVTQDCKVYLTNANGDEIDVFTTNNNGKYEFINIPDGVYTVTAITKVDGMGLTVVTIRDGIVYGDCDIKVAKADHISKREPTLLENIPDCENEKEAAPYKKAILAEKAFYDSLPDEERKQLSEEWIEKLFKLVGLVTDIDVSVTGGVIVDNVESVVSPTDGDSTIFFNVTVTETTVAEVDEDGINSGEEYEAEKIKDKKGKNKDIAKYYDITLSKNGQNISNIQKQTETNGKLRITMNIPEEHRGYKSYSVIHMHNGEAVTFADLDNNPDTITFEVDKFSTFALAYSDVEHTKTEKQEYTVKFSIYETGFESEPIEELKSITGTIITMPSCTYEREGYMFAGWIMADGTKVFLPAGAEFVPQTDTEFVPVWISINMNEGASVRLAEPIGLRFTSTVDAEGYNIIKAIDANAYCGTIITPMELVLGEEFTKMWMNTNSTPYLDVVNKGFAEENETTKTWRSVIANINEANYNREFAGRAYIEFTYTNGKTMTMYSDFNETDNSRAIAQVAKYELENNSDKYTAEQIEVLENYAQYAE